MKKFVFPLMPLSILLLVVCLCNAAPAEERSDEEIMREAMLLQVSDFPAPEPEPEPEPEIEDDPEPVHEEVAPEPIDSPFIEERAEPQQVSYSGSSFKHDGVWYYGDFKYTWYSSNVLHHYRTSEWTPDSQGVYRDSDGYAVVASEDYPFGSVISDTPFGAAKVYDCGCPSGVIDVYVNF